MLTERQYVVSLTVSTALSVLIAIGLFVKDDLVALFAPQEEKLGETTEAVLPLPGSSLPGTITQETMLVLHVDVPGQNIVAGVLMNDLVTQKQVHLDSTTKIYKSVKQVKNGIDVWEQKDILIQDIAPNTRITVAYRYDYQNEISGVAEVYAGVIDTE